MSFIYKLDRLGRSLKDLVNLVSEIQEKGVGLKSLNDEIKVGGRHPGLSKKQKIKLLLQNNCIKKEGYLFQKFGSISRYQE